MENNLSDKRALKILLSNIFFRTGKIITNIFLNIFLWKTTQDLQVISIFNLLYLSIHLFSHIFFAYVVKNWYRRLISMISMIGFSCIYWVLILLWKDIIDHYLLLAVVLWFFNGMYWTVYNINEFDVTNQKNRGNYQWMKKALKNINSIITPSIIGVIIWINYYWVWYEIAYSIWIFFFLISTLLSHVEITYSTSKFSLLKTFKILKWNRNIYKMLLNSYMLWFAISGVLISTILPLMLFTQGVDELKLGFLIWFFNILSIVVSYLFGKYIHYKNYKSIYIYSCIFYAILVVLLLLYPSEWYIIIFSSMLNLIYTFIGVPFSVFSSNIIHEVNEYEDIKSEYINIKEIFLSFWVMSSYIVIYFIWEFSIFWIKILFSIMAMVMLLSLFVFKSIDIKTHH